MIRFVALALLRMREMHGYEIQSIMQISRMELWTNILSGSLYHALNNLEKEGKIEAIREERTGSRIRKIYRITKAGEQEFQEQLKAALTAPPGSTKSDFDLALPWISELPKEEAKALLAQNVQQIEASIAEWTHGQDIKGKDNPLVKLSIGHSIEKMKLDIAYLNQVMNML